LISQTIGNDGLAVFLNQDNVEATGFELELNAFLANGFTSGVNYTFQKSDYQDSDKVWINSPRHMAKFNLSIPLIPDMFLSMEEQYISRLTTLSGGSAGNYYITNMTLYWQEAFRGMDISGSVYNLFDKDYGFPGGEEHVMDTINQDGINFRLKLIYKF
jgi:outer membrane receptor for ferrienterochelin and colicins